MIMEALASALRALSSPTRSCTICLGRDGSREKPINDLREFPRTRRQPQVAIVEDVELRVGDQAMHDLRVDEWDKRVVIPMQNQRRLLELVEPRNAGPAHSSQHLVEVAEHAAQVCCLCELVSELGPSAHLS